MNRPYPGAATLILLAIVVGWVGMANAASVRQVGFDELVQTSELIFRGRAVEAQSRASADGRSIVTDVWFDVRETYKGIAPGGRLRLVFAGGEHRGMAMKVHGLRLPTIGEEGVYFVEQLERPQVNPLFGWDQGHYLVRRDAAGVGRVFTSDGIAVVAAARADSPAQVQLSQGIPAGVTIDRTAAAGTALRLADFASTIRSTHAAQLEEAR
jgi:hypothetical protein